MHRSLAFVGPAALLAILVIAAVPVRVAGQAPAPAKGNGAAGKAYVQQKTPDGQPDLQGYWTTSTYIPLERPKGVTKEFYTPAEMAEIERREAAFEESHREAKPGDPGDVHYDRTQFGLTRSQIRFARNLRTSLIFDPPDGRIPPQTAEAQKRNAEVAAARKLRGGELDAVQNMAFDDRCVMMPGHQPPLFHSGYFPNYQIIQSPGYVTILSERLHDARIIPLDRRPFAPAKVRSWTGVSRGHWEGNTLVVETRNTNGKIQAAASGPMSQQAIVGASEDLRVIERFARLDADQIEYRFTIEDPKTWATPFSGEVPFVKMEVQGPFFEHACHEGNRAPANMLSVARHEEKKTADVAAKKRSN
jgi:hypothetical protein